MSRRGEAWEEILEQLGIGARSKALRAIHHAREGLEALHALIQQYAPLVKEREDLIAKIRDVLYDLEKIEEKVKEIM